MNAGYVRLRQTINGILAQRPAVSRYLWHFTLGLAAGRATIGGLAPLSTALAAVAPFLPEQPAWPLLAGLLTGILMRGSLYTLTTPPADMLAAVVGFSLAMQLRKNDGEDPLPVLPVVAGGAQGLVKSCLQLVLHQGAGVWPGLVSEGLLTGVFTIPAWYALAGVRLARPELVRWLFLLFLALCGFGDLRLGTVELREVLGRSLLLFTGGSWGAPWGAAAGVVLGLLSGDLWQMLTRIGLYAGTGFCSGLLRSKGRRGVLLGFGLASILFTFFYRTPAELSGHLLASGLAGAAYLVCSSPLERLLGRPRKEPRRRIQAEVGLAQRTRPGEPICGDSLSLARPTADRLLLAVSDGMGAGIQAARASRITVKMLEQLIGGGSSPELAAEAVNTALYLRGGEESAATIDLALVDLAGGLVDFLKAGAPPSFVKREREVEMVRSACWPAGLLERLETGVLRRDIQPGDLLVMVSDGITEVEEGDQAPGDWLYDFLRRLPVEEAQPVAELILKNALVHSGHRNRDDMTVVVARFGSEGELG